MRLNIFTKCIKITADNSLIINQFSVYPDFTSMEKLYNCKKKIINWFNASFLDCQMNVNMHMDEKLTLNYNYLRSLF